MHLKRILTFNLLIVAFVVAGCELELNELEPTNSDPIEALKSGYTQSLGESMTGIVSAGDIDYWAVAGGVDLVPERDLLVYAVEGAELDVRVLFGSPIGGGLVSCPIGGEFSSLVNGEIVSWCVRVFEFPSDLPLDWVGFSVTGAGTYSMFVAP